MISFERIILKNINVPDINEIASYEQQGGYQALRKALRNGSPQSIVDEVKASGLRGRGGAGFPTWQKWSFLPRDVYPRFLVCNADEGEPGTFKDREIMEHNSHVLIEGIIISSYAIEANLAFIYVRGDYSLSVQRLQKAIDQARSLGYLGQNIMGSGYALNIALRRGAGSYVCGEETALLESLEGKRGIPRIRPPFPTSNGLYGKPTVINNVETLANIPAIILRGGAWYATIGTPMSTGTRIFSLSGHVNRPGTYELPMSIPLRTLIEEYGGGIPDGQRLKAMIPGGLSAPLLPADKIDTPLDFESIAAAGSNLGTAGVIVMDETTCMVQVALRQVQFYYNESCGKCTPCRIGIRQIRNILATIAHGQAGPADLNHLTRLCETVHSTSLCGLGQTAPSPILTSLRHFREEYMAHVVDKHCPTNNCPMTGKTVSALDGRSMYDHSHHRW